MSLTLFLYSWYVHKDQDVLVFRHLNAEPVKHSLTLLVHLGARAVSGMSVSHTYGEMCSYHPCAKLGHACGLISKSARVKYIHTRFGRAAFPGTWRSPVSIFCFPSWNEFIFVVFWSDVKWAPRSCLLTLPCGKGERIRRVKVRKLLG